MSDMNTEALRTIADHMEGMAAAIRGMLERQANPAVTVGVESALLDDSPPCAGSGPHCGHWCDGKDICCACTAVVAADATPAAHETANRDAVTAYFPAVDGSDTIGSLVDRALAQPSAEPTPAASLPSGQPVDLDALGLGAVVRATYGGWRRTAVRTGAPPWLWHIQAEPSYDLNADVCKAALLSDVVVLHPGITLPEGQS